jgi:oxalate decarboxylase/phosphoglucose isomerase-like protein (cupin superfamily)
MTFSLAGEVITASQGTTVVIPAKTVHGWKNSTQMPVRMLAIFMPGGVEPMFEQLAGLAPNKVAELAASFGTVVVGPPLD